MLVRWQKNKQDLFEFWKEISFKKYLLHSYKRKLEILISIITMLWASGCFKFSHNLLLLTDNWAKASISKKFLTLKKYWVLMPIV
jgi:hypothetical protein